MRNAALFAATLALSCGFAHAEQSSLAPARMDDLVDTTALLDPAASKPAQLAALGKLKECAGERSSWCLYLLGTLYRLGDVHPAAPLPADAEKARIYLSNAATLGRISAMAGMAELELAAGKSSEALTWTYVYLYYFSGDGSVELKGTPARPPRSGDGYSAGLLSRVLKQVDASDIDRSRAALAAQAFIGKYDATIHSSLQTSVATSNASAADEGMVMGNRNSESLEQRKRRAIRAGIEVSTLATFLITFGPDGQRQSIVLEDVLPGTRPGDIAPLQAIAKGLTVGKKPAGSKPRVARIPVSFIADGLQVKKN